VLTSVKTIDNGRWTNDPAYSVKLLGETLNPITSSHGLSMRPNARLADNGKFDVIIIPGGPGARQEQYPESLLRWLVANANYAKHIVSLTSGAFILARAGLLKHRRITTYPAFVADIKQIEPGCNVSSDERIMLDDGRLFSSSGISSAIEAALALVERMEGFRSAELAAKRISWPCPIDDFVPVYSS
jgi:transcriptional regulator GlxA family with amidase domain